MAKAAGMSMRTIGDLVAEDYRRAGVFEHFGIDFCCGGDRTVRAACRENGTDYGALTQALADLEREGGREGAEGTGTASEPGSSGRGDRSGVTDPRAWPPEVLAEYIVAVHHAYARQTLPGLAKLAGRVAAVHGERHPELHEVRALLSDLAAELGRHMEEEERDLFPRIAELASAQAGEGMAAPRGAGVEDGCVAPLPLESLEDDHEAMGRLLKRVQQLSGGYVAPGDACAAYRTLYGQLEELESDLHRHVHLENNVLFPRVRALAVATGGGAVGA